ncbi:hypothetical protein BGZ97_008237 [Linnemannia gamsii]|jgi:ornithine cyclodeaminase|uniref:NAD(P)-binding protein n=1 Tax=Linnemannia gamsii TaxID=64522 RepID=A0A9P6UES6_9FUNG|nr:hypothetical protein BGZ97_008237 [Linnemannia gamsii]
MPSRIDTLTSTVKIVSVPKTDSKEGLPGVTIVLDNKTGEPRGLVNARLLTAVRTAAGSALATRVIFSNKEQEHKKTKELSLVVFGSGAQAKAHIQLLTHILPDQISRIVICNRTLPRAHDLVQELAPECSAKSIDISAFSITTGKSSTSSSSPGTGTGGSPQDKLREIVQTAHIICTCTNTTSPLFPGEWVQPGTHLNMVGSYTPQMHEVDQNLIARAWTLVDAKKECEHEAGEFILAKKQTGENGVLAELGEIFAEDGRVLKDSLPKEFVEVVQDQARGNINEKKKKDVTIFKSVGIAAQDVAITALVLDKAEAMGLGSVVDI